MEFGGCPDTDGDGIIDTPGQCPAGRGLKEFNGCPATDGDGLEDRKDKCPTIAGPIEGEGCPDSDGDGVSDYFDKCPGTPKGVKVDGSGCPLPVAPMRDTIVQKTTTYIITEEDRQVVREAFRNLEFDFGKSTIRPRSVPYLNRVADLVVKKGSSVKLAGHTDSVGSDAANLKVSRNRSESVKNYLVNQGASSSRIEA